MSYLKDYSLFSLPNIFKPTVQCTNKNDWSTFFLRSPRGGRGELFDRDPNRLECELCHLGFLLGACVILFSRSKLWSIQIEESTFS